VEGAKQKHYKDALPPSLVADLLSPVSLLRFGRCEPQKTQNGSARLESLLIRALRSNSIAAFGQILERMKADSTIPFSIREAG